MKFGNHTPTTEHPRGGQSPMAVFTRGLQVSGGTQWKFKFANGYGASVINDGYGGDRGLYELAVLDAGGSICYDTPLTSDVLGYLTEDEVTEALDKIRALTEESIAAAAADREDQERQERIAELRAELARLECEVRP